MAAEKRVQVSRTQSENARLSEFYLQARAPHLAPVLKYPGGYFLLLLRSVVNI